MPNKITEESLIARFGERRVHAHFHGAFEGFSSGDPLVLKTLSRVLRREENLEATLHCPGKQSERTTHKELLDIALTQLGHMQPDDSKLLKSISNRIHRIPLISTGDRTDLYRLSGTNKSTPPDLFRKFVLVLSAVSRLFSRIILGRNTWNEIPNSSTGNKLLVGSLLNSLSRDLEALKITSVLSITEAFENEPCALSRPYSASELEEKGITQAWIEAIDHEPLNIEQLNKAADFIYRQLRKGNVYVHCRAGCGRSNMAIAAYLIKYEGYTVAEASDLIKQSRPPSTINKDGKQKALNLFHEHCTLQEKLKSSSPPTIEQLHEAADSIHKLLKEEENVYIHSFAKQVPNRSSMAMAAYLIKYKELSDEHAIDQIKQLRPTSTIYRKDKQKALQLFLDDVISQQAQKQLDDISKDQSQYFTERCEELLQDAREKKDGAKEQLTKDIPRQRYVFKGKEELLKATPPEDNINAVFKKITELTRRVFKGKEELLKATPPEDNIDAVFKKITELTQKESVSESLLQILLSQTGVTPATCFLFSQKPPRRDDTVLQIWNPQIGETSKRKWIIQKEENRIKVDIYAEVLIVGPSAPKQRKIEGYLKTTFIMDVTTPDEPTLTCKLEKIQDIPEDDLC